MIEIKRSYNTPEVFMNKEKLCIVGCSFEENSNVFYEKLLKKILSNNMKNKFLLVFGIEYMNSISTRGINKIMGFFNELVEMGSEVDVAWYFEHDDMEMLKEGKIFEEIHTELKFSFLSVEDISDLTYV